jgi:hypothetical protein
MLLAPSIIVDRNPRKVRVPDGKTDRPRRTVIEAVIWL